MTTRVAKQTLPGLQLPTGRSPASKPTLVRERKASWSVSIPIRKIDDDQHLAFGWASIAVDEDGNLVIDHQGDVISPDTLEKAAYAYVERKRGSSEMHEQTNVARLVESFVLTPEKRTAMGLDPSPDVRWWVGFRVLDEATWQKVKSGELAEFSIGGSGVRKPIDAPTAG